MLERPWNLDLGPRRPRDVQQVGGVLEVSGARDLELWMVVLGNAIISRVVYVMFSKGLGVVDSAQWKM